MMIGGQILKEINARIQFLMDVGLNYLTLSRATGSLSGGEAQRIRLATQIAPAWWEWPISWTSPASGSISG
mgnify:CR=1 FL=1